MVASVLNSKKSDMKNYKLEPYLLFLFKRSTGFNPGVEHYQFGAIQSGC